MNKITTKTAVMTALTFAMVAGTAQAGGLERGGYNIDLLFDPSTYAAEATATYVNPQRELNNVVDINPANGIGSNGIGGGKTDGVRDTESYWVPRVGVKAAFGDSIDCMADYSQPWGAHTNAITTLRHAPTNGMSDRASSASSPVGSIRKSVASRNVW